MTKMPLYGRGQGLRQRLVVVEPSQQQYIVVQIAVFRLEFFAHLFFVIRYNFYEIAHYIWEEGDTHYHDNDGYQPLTITDGKIVAIADGTQGSQRVVATYNQSALVADALVLEIEGHYKRIFTRWLIIWCLICQIDMDGVALLPPHVKISGVAPNKPVFLWVAAVVVISICPIVKIFLAVVMWVRCLGRPRLAGQARDGLVLAADVFVTAGAGFVTAVVNCRNHRLMARTFSSIIKIDGLLKQLAEKVPAASYKVRNNDSNQHKSYDFVYINYLVLRNNFFISALVIHERFQDLLELGNVNELD